MGLAVLEDHLELARVARAFLERQGGRAPARKTLDGGDPTPLIWKELAEMGWLGLAVAPEYGGSGYGLMELAVVVEELGRQCSPGPFLPTVVGAAAVAAVGSSTQRDDLLPRLVAGDMVVGLSLNGGRDGLQLDDGVLRGAAGFVMCATTATALFLAVGDDLVVVDPHAEGVHIDERGNLDPTRPCATVRFENVAVGPSTVLQGGRAAAQHAFEVLVAAECAGGAGACVEMAADYARQRVAFGRPIGQFQAIKHHCANMLVDEQLTVGVVWEALRRGAEACTPLAAKAAAVVAVPAFLRNARVNIQVHAGIGFTWEHDAHIYLRRATAVSAFVGSHSQRSREVAELQAKAGGGRVALDLPPEAEAIALEVQEFLAEYHSRPAEQRHRFLVDQGYLYPHWPRPYGRDAGTLEQIVVDQVLADVPRFEPLGRPAWTLPIVLPTIMAHGTDDQKARWIRPTMEAELRWCQLFSEPGAGSDLASLSTRADRVDGGWVVNGQKVWTSTAHEAKRGFALVRTDREAPKHRGITCMVIDMDAKGVAIRPLRQITGGAEFNEVFLDEVFVPDGDVVGPINGGWAVALTTLGNERVSLGGIDATTGAAWSFLHEVARAAGSHDEGDVAEIGELTAAAIAARGVILRVAARAVTGAEPGVEGNLTKLITTSQAQRVDELAMRLLGPDGVYLDGRAESVSFDYLRHRSSTIAGGTSEILRNIIGERALGLPRDALPPKDPTTQNGRHRNQ